jgi:transcription antitermination factor NusG
MSMNGGPIVVSTAYPDAGTCEPGAAGGQGSKWFAVYTTPRHEKAVARQFDVRRIEAFLPLHRVVRRWRNGCKANVDQPLFPNYVFAWLDRLDYVRVLQTPGVLSLVGSGREPSPLATCEIEALRAELPLRKFEPYPYLAAGDRVRIHSGALAGMVGVLLRKKSNLRVVLTLDLIMQSVAVEIDADEIEPVRM